MRRPRYFVLLILVLAALGSVAPSIIADQADELFEQHFGKRVAAAQKSPSYQDDIDLAAELLEVAGKMKEQPALLSVICEAAYRLGLKHPKGYETSAQAMRLRVQAVPMHSKDSRQKLLDVYQKLYSRSSGKKKGQLAKSIVPLMRDQAASRIKTGNTDRAIALYRQSVAIATRHKLGVLDALRAELDWQLGRHRARKRVTTLLKDLVESPNHSPRKKELMSLLIVDLDNLTEAREYVLLADPKTKQLIDLAGKLPANLTEAQCKFLGDQYFEYSKSGSPHAKTAMLQHAHAYYDRFVFLHSKKDDLDSTVVVLALDRIKKQLKQLKLKPANLDLSATGRSQAVLTKNNPAAKPDKSDSTVIPKPVIPKGRITVTGSSQVKEKLDLIETLRKTHPQTLKGVEKLHLIRAYDAASKPMRQSGGATRQLANAFSSQPYIGKTGFKNFMIFGPYTQLESGRYLVVARVMLLDKATGKILSLNVAQKGKRLVDRHTTADKCPLGQWHYAPALFSVDAPAKGVEYRIWQHGHALAVDRIYIFKIN